MTLTGLLVKAEAGRVGLANILNIIILDKQLIFLNLWSIVHFTSGVVIMLLILRFGALKKVREYKYLGIFFLLVAYEIVEWAVYNNYPGLIAPETKVDAVWDLIYGMAGGFMCTKIAERKRERLESGFSQHI